MRRSVRIWCSGGQLTRYSEMLLFLNPVQQCFSWWRFANRGVEHADLMRENAARIEAELLVNISKAAEWHIS